MSLRMKAIISGIVIESVLLALMFSGIADGGSCKPEGFGLMLIMLHYPALILEPYLPPLVVLPVVAIVCAAGWSLVAFLFLRMLRLIWK